MFDRIVLIVDDDEDVNELRIPLFYKLVEMLKKVNQKYKDYQISFIYKRSVNDAVVYLREKNTMVDVVLIDYKFNNSMQNETGIDLVELIRREINKHCQLVFWTMQTISGIGSDDFIKLINSNVYRFIDKSIENSEIVRILFEAATSCDSVVISIERFWNQYRSILDSASYTILDRDMTFDELLRHIRMDDEIGKEMIDMLMQMALLDATEKGLVD